MTCWHYELRDVSKQYGQVAAVQNVSVQFAGGSHTAVLGPSGGGKSTILRLVAGLEAPTSGTILLNGELASEAGRIRTPPHRRGIAMVFQDLALWPNLSVRGNVRLGLSGTQASRKDATNRVAEALELCGITELADRLPGQLSGGQQQRAALARAIAVNPQFLVLDEPFSGVDLETKSRILAEIAHLAETQRFTVLLVSHDPLEAVSLCQKALLVQNGRVRIAGDLHEVLVSEHYGAVEILRRCHDMISALARPQASRAEPAP